MMLLKWFKSEKGTLRCLIFMGEQHIPIKITEQLAHIHQLNNLELAQNGNYTLLVTIIAIIYSGSN